MSTEIVSVSIPASLSHTGTARRCDKPIDREVADLVRRLNHPANGDEPITAASCGGHDTAPPTITLADGDSTLVLMQTRGDVAVASMALGFEPGREWKRFRLLRHVDVSGVSGTGHVADGWAIEAVAVVCWRGFHPTTTVHHGGMESVEAIHCHGGRTVIEWVE
jgi:hypothetical protein